MADEVVKPIMALYNDDGAMAFYRLEAIIPVEYAGEVRDYAILVGLAADRQGRRESCVLRFFREEGNDGALEYLREPEEVDAVMSAVTTYFAAEPVSRRVDQHPAT